MKIKALVSFCGSICMTKDEIRECSDEALLADLLKAGYVETVEESQNPDEIKKPGRKQDSAKEGADADEGK